MASKKESSFKKMRKNFNVMAASTVLFCLTVFTVIQFIFMDDIYLFAAKINLINSANDVAQLFFSGEDFETKVADYEAQENLYIEIYSPKDTLVYTTDSNKTMFEPTQNDEPSIELKPRIMKILSRSQQRDNSYFELRQERFASAQYVVYGNFYENNTAIELYYPIDVIKENANTASWTAFALCIFALTLISITAFTYAGSFTKPIKRITESTKKIASMNFDEKCPDFSIKELNELSENINTLSSSLNKAMTELKEKNTHLERSIEKELQLEKQRKTFVANVSHELKTPISIIRGYAEGMKCGVGCESTDEFCDIIIEESDKMNNLVIRLMELVQYSVGNYNINVTRFNIKETVEDCISLRKRQIYDNDIDLQIEINERFFALADIELFCNIFNNYLSNALSHISGDKQLIIKANQAENKYRISVYNSGAPIPGSDIENIWQSFYRADKAHSRKEGRFGLGLSIVSILQELHNEKYGVSNMENGVEFWFDVKRAE